MIVMDPGRLRYLDDGELLALFAGTLALRVRTHEDHELIDCIGREFRTRKSPGNPDEWMVCRCGLPAILHDPVDLACPLDDEPGANVTAGEWERVRPFVFGEDEAA